MVSSDFRKIAREKLSGKWETAVVMTVLYSLITYLMNVIQAFIPEETLLYSLYSIVVSLISVPLTFGFAFALFKLFYGEKVKSFSFWSLGFDNFGKSWGIALRTTLKLIVPLILLIVSIIFLTASSIVSLTLTNTSDIESVGFLGLVSFILMMVSIFWMVAKSYYYSLAQFVAFDNPNLTAKECINKSKELMTGRRGKLLCLQFSFFGWIVLTTFTLGIGFFWLTPYMQMATIAFYHVLSGKDKNQVVENNQ